MEISHAYKFEISEDCKLAHPDLEQTELPKLSPAITGIVLKLNNIMINTLAFGALISWFFSVKWIVMIGYFLMATGILTMMLRLAAKSQFKVIPDKGIFLEESCILFNKNTPFFAENQILAIGITGRFQQTDTSEWWEYSPAFVEHTGTIHPLNKYIKNGYLQAVQQATQIASCLKLPLVVKDEKQFIHTRVHDKKLQIYYSSEALKNQKKADLMATIVLAIVTAVLYAIESGIF